MLVNLVRCHPHNDIQGKEKKTSFYRKLILIYSKQYKLFKFCKCAFERRNFMSKDYANLWKLLRNCEDCNRPK